MNIKNVIDPMGLLSEPTSVEIKEWEDTKLLSDNPYTFIGFLVYNRKQKLEQQLNKIIDND
tara:strand:- start:343 stop:525 length:183 start_codon:yes stop_codon:yes gene_type:complete